MCIGSMIPLLQGFWLSRGPDQHVLTRLIGFLVYRQVIVVIVG